MHKSITPPSMTKQQPSGLVVFFFFKDTATTEIYPLSLHDALPISSVAAAAEGRIQACVLLGGNLFASNPDRAWTAAALRKIPTSISITTKLNEGHLHGRGRGGGQIGRAHV